MKTTTLVAFATTLFLTATVSAETYQVTVTNNLEEELLAPVVITSIANDKHIFADDYVTAEVEELILTGNPQRLAERIGKAGGTSIIAHSTTHSSGTLLQPGHAITYEIESDDGVIRVLAMIAPTVQPDNYVTDTINIGELNDQIPLVTKNIDRYDVGNNEGRKEISEVDDDVATVVIVKKK